MKTNFCIPRGYHLVGLGLGIGIRQCRRSRSRYRYRFQAVYMNRNYHKFTNNLNEMHDLSW